MWRESTSYLQLHNNTFNVPKNGFKKLFGDRACACLDTSAFASLGRQAHALEETFWLMQTVGG